MSKGLELLCDSRHGQFIPQLMAWRLSGWMIGPDDAKICDNGPDDFYYWETWAHILDHAEYTDENGYVWRLHHDGDLWAYCEELMTDEEKENFFGEY